MNLPDNLLDPALHWLGWGLFAAVFLLALRRAPGAGSATVPSPTSGWAPSSSSPCCGASRPASCPGSTCTSSAP